MGNHIADLAEPVDGPSLSAAAALSAKHKVACLLAYPERGAEKVYNLAALYGKNGDLLVNFRKLHLSGPFKKAEFSPGDDIVTAEINGVTVAPLICYDVEISEAMRAAARAGAHLITVPTALRAQYLHLTKTMIPTRAFENGVYVAYVNHAGDEGEYRYCGHSTLAGPAEKPTCAGGDAELLICKMDTDEIKNARAELPYLKEARRDLAWR